MTAAAVICRRDRVLGRLSQRHWAALIHRFAAARYTAGDVLWALGHTYEGREFGYTDPVLHVAGWARNRLAAHLDQAGMPLSSHSQRCAAAREADRRRADVQRAAGILAPAMPGPEPEEPAGTFAQALAHAAAEAAAAAVRAPPDGARVPDAASLRARMTAYRARRQVVIRRTRPDRSAEAARGAALARRLLRTRARGDRL